MADYERLYQLLFNGVTDAIETIDEQNYGSAKEKLISIQQEAENLYIEQTAEECLECKQ